MVIQDKQRPYETGGISAFPIAPDHTAFRQGHVFQSVALWCNWLAESEDRWFTVSFLPLQIFFYAFRKEKQRRKYYLRTTISWRKKKKTNNQQPHTTTPPARVCFLSVCVCVFMNKKICWMRESVRNTRHIDCWFLIPWWC